MRARSTGIILAVAAALAAVLAVAAWFALRPKARPNVILISIDTLRPDRMGVYGHRPMGRSTTPFLDELAAKGAVFTRAYSSSSWTLPGHYALMTGLPDRAHGMVNDRVPPPGEIPMMAEVLKKAGYATAGFFSGPYLDPLFGFARGFDVYESCMEPAAGPGRGPRTAGPGGGPEPAGPGRGGGAAETRGGGSGGASGAPRTKFPAHELVTSKEVTEKGYAFVSDHVRRRPKEPFFLFLHYFDVHNDYLPPPPFDTRFGPPYHGWVNGRGVTSDPRYNPKMAPEDLARLEALYDGEIGWVDDNIRRLFRGIETLSGGILENTLVVVTSDHGEEFLEHGRTGHRKNLFECSVRIPLIMVFPGRIAKGIRPGDTARIYDILPTVTGLAGLEAPSGLMGRSLEPAFSGGSREPRPVLLDLTKVPKDGTVTRLEGLVMGKYKLIVEEERKWPAGEPALFDGRVMSEKKALFDLEKDPGESRDLAAVQGETAARLRSLLGNLLDEAATIARGRGGSGRRTTGIPGKLKKSLEELGYGGGGR